MKPRVFRDPVHGLISFDGDSTPLAQLLDTAVMQRLRYVKAMGLAWLVYPGAEHSRFGHSLGALHVAGKIASRLELTPHDTIVVQAAALLHDIGHGPFSHAWEEAFPNYNHEAMGLALLQSNEELRTTLEKVHPDLANDVQSLFQGDKRFSHLKKMVSSDLDVDRLDYLLRDSHYSGAKYAAFDLDWIIHALRMEESKDGKDIVVDYRRGMYAVEQYLFSRAYMYTQVYHHKTVRAAERLFVSVLRRFKDLAVASKISAPASLLAMAHGEFPSAEQFLTLDDPLILTLLGQWQNNEDSVLSDLSSRMRRRDLFKTIDLGDRALDTIEEVVQTIGKNELGDSWDYYLHIDVTDVKGYGSGSPNELQVVGHPVMGRSAMSELMQSLPSQRRTVRVVGPKQLLPLVVDKLT